MLRVSGLAGLCNLLFFHLVYCENLTSDKVCPTPVAPDNAMAIGNNTIGSTVTFLCKEGYFRLGKPFQVKCKEDRHWTEANVTCIARSCGDPGIPFNGERIGWLFQYGDNVTFKCLPGYVLRGSKTRTCLINQTWSGKKPICKPISCGEPPVLADAEMFGDSYVYKARVYYTCRDGYQIQGSRTLTCGAEGKWRGAIPICKAVICEDPGVPEHGSREGRELFKYNSQVAFRCDKGYILFGSHHRTCITEGKWSGVQPYCAECAKVGAPVFIRKGVRFIPGSVKEKRGGIVTVSTGANEEEDVIIIGRGTQHYPIVEDKVPSAKDIFKGSSVIAKVGNGKYTLAKVKTISRDKYEVTFEDRKKSTASLAIDNIRILNPPRFCAICQDPGTPEFGSREDNLEEFIPGMKVEYGCEANTELTGSRIRECLSSGEWTGESPQCKITSCWDLDVLPPAHGRRDGNNFKVDSEVTFSCNHGYELIGERSLTCRPDGRWSGDVPVCKDRCDSVTCEAWEKCIYDVSTGPKCVCREVLDCPPNFKPVCGSNAAQYNNYCILKAEACREGTTLEKVADGSCTPSGICQIIPRSHCRGFFRNFYYNQSTKACESIIAGGCHPSGWNGFTSLKDCNRTCLVDICSKAADPGPCNRKIKRWAFNPKAGLCKRFKYGGCFGNENNFESKEQCSQTCMSDVKRRKDVCPKCIQAKIREACTGSTFAAIGQLQSRLPEDTQRKHARFLVQIERVIKNSSGSLPVGSAVLSVPYKESAACPCPMLPFEKFILMDNVIIESSQQNPKPGLIITQMALVQNWSKEFLVKLRRNRKCSDSLNLDGLI